MKNDYILNIEDLSKSYIRPVINKKGENLTEYTNVLNNFYLKLEKGKIISALIGGNGSGKSTLFNVINGFTKPNRMRGMYQGNVLFHSNNNDYNLLESKPYQTSNYGIGRLFQENNIFGNLTVLDNMLLGDDNKFGEHPYQSLFFYKKTKSVRNQKEEKVKNIFVELLGEDLSNNQLWLLKDKLAKDISLGQKRLLCFARLMMRDYELLLLDEPTSGINEEIINRIKHILKFFTYRGKTVFLIEHNLQFVNDVADYCYYINDGKIVFEGKPYEVLNKEDVKKNYLGQLC